MQSPEGGFYSTQDADSEGEEGKFFVWSLAEVETVLGKELARDFARAYDVTKSGNFEGHNILHEAAPLDEEQRARLAGARKKLWEVRERRVKPGLDDKVLADWNGLILHALAEAGPALAEPRYTEAARRCARFWTGTMLGEGGRLVRVWRRGRKETSALQIDYTSLGLGLVALYQATFELEWLERARRLASTMIELFWDKEGEGFFGTEGGKAELIARTKNPHDGATPSGNSVAAHFLLALHRLTGEDALREHAEKTLRLFREILDDQPGAVLNMAGALQEHLEGPPEIALVARRDDPELERMLTAVHERFLPGAAVAWRAPDVDPPPLVGLLKGKEALAGKATAHVCRNFACELPVTSVEDLVKRLERR
jgi:uncharacterized protein YyaL (SSP411 family)